MKVIFVCWGNICRSPMAERVAQRVFTDAGLDVNITSAAVSSEELGAPMDARAARTLRAAGYNAANHRAHQITADEVRDADLVIAAEQLHINRLLRLVPDADNLRLINDFNPALRQGTPLADPWYGPESGFSDTLADIEAAMPGLVAELR